MVQSRYTQRVTARILLFLWHQAQVYRIHMICTKHLALLSHPHCDTYIAQLCVSPGRKRGAVSSLAAAFDAFLWGKFVLRYSNALNAVTLAYAYIHTNGTLLLWLATAHTHTRTPYSLPCTPNFRHPDSLRRLMMTLLLCFFLPLLCYRWPAESSG